MRIRDYLAAEIPHMPLQCAMTAAIEPLDTLGWRDLNHTGGICAPKQRKTLR